MAPSADEDAARLERELEQIDGRLEAQITRVASITTRKSIAFQPQARRSVAFHGDQHEMDHGNNGAGGGQRRMTVTSRENDTIEKTIRLQNQLMSKFNGSTTEVLKALDTNGDGLLSVGELHDALKRLHLGLPLAELKKIFRVLDPGGQGEIDIEEFMQPPDRPTEVIEDDSNERRSVDTGRRKSRKSVAVGSYTTGKTDGKTYDKIYLLQQNLLERCGTLDGIAAAVDTNSDGQLTVGEVQDSLKRLRLGLPLSEMKKVFGVLDVNNLGVISVEQLMRPPIKPDHFKVVVEEAPVDDAVAIRRNLKIDPGFLPPVDRPTLEVIARFRRLVLDRFGTDRAAMKMLDNTHSGLICLGELAAALGRTRIPFPYKDLKTLYRSLDHDGGGQLNFFELFHLTPPELPAYNPFAGKLEARFARTLAASQLPCSPLVNPEPPSRALRAEFGHMLKTVLHTHVGGKF